MALPKLKKTRHPNIRKDPKGRFWVDIELNGKRQRTLCGSLQLAQDYLSSIREGDRRAQLFPEEARAVEARSITVAELAERFEADIAARVKPKTLASYHGSDKHLQRFFGGRPILYIDAEEVRAFRKAREDEGAAVSSINRDVERLRNLLNLAEDARMIPRSPLRGRRLLVTAENDRRYLTEEEEERLRAWCEKNDPELWLMIHFSLLTGLRAREQWLLRWEQVHHDHLNVNRPKTSTRDHLPIRATVRGILDQQRGKHDVWVWPNEARSTHIDHDNLSTRRFKRARRGAKITGFKWHHLRHTFCTRLLNRGIDLYVVMALAGHSSMETTRKYAHHAPSKLATSLDVLEPRA